MSHLNIADPPVPSSRGATSQIVPVKHRGAMVAFVLERLGKAVGPKRAGEVMHQALATFDEERRLDAPQDLLEIAERLVRQGGLVQAVGRSLKVQALLRGAVER
jgi:hypothetical protein